MDIILSEDESQKQVVAECRLPFSFNVVPKLPAAQGKRKRAQVEQEGDLPTIEARTVRRRMVMDSEETLVSPLVLSPNASSRPAPLDATKPPTQTIAPPVTEGESTPTLMEVNPESGSITGGATLWLQGMDFPTLFPLFARFGSAVVPTVSSLITFVRHFLIDCSRYSGTPIFLPVACLPQPHRALSMLHYRSIHRQMRRSMEPASQSSIM